MNRFWDFIAHRRPAAAELGRSMSMSIPEQTPVPDTQQLSVVFTYSQSEEEYLSQFLNALQTEIGGKRSPYFAKAGGLDLVSFLTGTIVGLSGVALRPIVQKYFEGLLNADGVKKLGEEHRKQITEWFADLNASLSKTIGAIHSNLRLIHTSFTFSGKEKALTLEVPTDAGSLFVVLNHANISPNLLRALPQGIVSAIRFIYEVGFPDETIAFQLYYDRVHEQWPYLFAPTVKGFGNHIDRYVDLRLQRTELIASQQEFVTLFSPAVDDEFKFLVSPFR